MRFRVQGIVDLPGPHRRHPHRTLSLAPGRANIFLDVITSLRHYVLEEMPQRYATDNLFIG